MKTYKVRFGIAALACVVALAAAGGCGQTQSDQIKQSNLQALAQLRAQEKEHPVSVKQQETTYTNYIMNGPTPPQYKAQAIAAMKLQVEAYNASLHRTTQ